MSHALVVGGTGMLATVTRSLARRGTVTVVARGEHALRQCASAAVTPLSVDYTDADALHTGLREAVSARGPFDLCVASIHSSAPDAPLAVARYVDGRYFHVLGSTSADPAVPDSGRRAAFEALDSISYHEVILGFVVEAGDSRWLTNDEIAAGVLDAIAAGAPRHVVGTVEPWTARP